jgi:drug/metabolite transporter (DMT)-like permease
MNTLMVAAGLSVVASTTHAVTAVVQERLAARVRVSVQRSGGWLSGAVQVLGNRRWWIAVGLAALAALLHVAALRFGPLTVVQPLSALTLVLALPLRAVVIGRRVSATEWRGAALTVAGLAGLLMLTASGKPTQTLSSVQVGMLVGVAGVVLLALVSAARVASRLVVQSLLLAVASGVSFGVSSALTQTVVVRVSDAGLVAAASPAAAAVLLLATGGLLLAQAAYRGGLGAPLAALTLVNPVVAGLVGITLLDERYVGGVVGAVAAIAAALVAARGVITLAMPPVDVSVVLPAPEAEVVPSGAHR